ncbi:SEL1-like repeat protein [bacterium]|nr:SEL1-like repeat protein [bacterium]
MEQNYAEAFKWYMESAKQGYADAESQVACLYATGSGVGQNNGEAAEWFK